MMRSSLETSDRPNQHDSLSGARRQDDMREMMLYVLEGADFPLVVQLIIQQALDVLFHDWLDRGVFRRSMPRR